MPAQLQAPLSGPAGTAAARRRSGALAATAAGLLITTIWLGAHFVPSTEAVRVRNAFLAQAGVAADADWRPPAVPAGFLQQSGAPPRSFAVAAAAAAQGTGALERAVSLMNQVNPGRRRGGPIQGTTTEAFEVIAATGTGYCGDYTQVMNGLGWAAGLPVREWGMSFDGFGGLGHAFSEVYDPALGDWIMVDVFNGFWVRDRQTGRALSALAFRERLRLDDPLATVELVRFTRAGRAFRSAADMIDYYRRGVEQFYLWWGNNVFDYDAHPAVRAAGPLGRSIEQVVAILAGVHPGIRIIATPGNGEMIAALGRTRTRVTALVVTWVLLAVALAWQLATRTRTRTAG